MPLNALAPAGVRFEVYDCLLSEAAVLGFEFGYSVADHRTLVLWEAQFGDFMNGAQVIIDQFLAGSETKWGQPSGLVLLLPHGYEGQGPEHSSARIERFLTLCAEDNMRVAYPSTPASYFHLLRCQGREPRARSRSWSSRRRACCATRAASRRSRSWPRAASSRCSTTAASDPARCGASCSCSGKVYYDLLEGARGRRSADDVAIVRVEQLYPFPRAELDAVARALPAAGRARLVPGGAAQHGRLALRARALPRRRRLRLGPRSCATSAARPRPPRRPGSLKVHLAEQDALVEEALG